MKNIIKNFTRKTSIDVITYAHYLPDQIFVSDLDHYFTIHKKNEKVGVYLLSDLAKHDIKELVLKDSHFDKDDIPNMPSKNEVFKQIEKSIISKIPNLESFVSNDYTTRVPLTGIYIDKENSNIAGTNGRILKSIKLNTIEKDSIPESFIVQLKTALFIESMKNYELLDAEISKECIKLKYMYEGNILDYTAKLIDGPYPNYMAIIPEKSERKMKISSDLLAELKQKLPTIIKLGCKKTQKMFITDNQIIFKDKDNGFRNVKLDNEIIGTSPMFNAKSFLLIVKQYIGAIELSINSDLAAIKIDNEGVLTILMPVRPYFNDEILQDLEKFGKIIEKTELIIESKKPKSKLLNRIKIINLISDNRELSGNEILKLILKKEGK